MKTVFTSALLLVTLITFGQTRITGRVTGVNGEGIPLANVILENTYDGTSADAAGNFQFTTTETGEQQLVVKIIGYREFRRAVTLNGEPLTISVQLAEMINELEAVTISAGAFTASDESRRTVFKALDIATTAGATADIAGALNTLPGTQKVGESGRLFVRGGDDSEARTFIDGMVVLDAYSPSAPNTPSRGRFLPFMFKGTSFSTGGYSAEYGQALSSVLALDSKDQAENTRTDIGILSVGGDVAHTQAWNGGSAAGKLQYTNLRPYVGLISQRIDWKSAPASIEGVAAFRQKVGRDAMVKFYGNMNNADFSLYQPSIDNTGTKYYYRQQNDYRYMNGAYKDILNDQWLVRGGISYTSVQNTLMFDDRHVLEAEKGVHGKAVLEGSLSDKVELKAGAEVIQRNYSWDADSAGYGRNQGFDEVMAAGFAEADVYASNRFVTRAGVRMEYTSLTGQFSADPRISLAYKAGAHGQVSLAYGRFRQTANNQYVRVNPNLDPEKADHYILNYQMMVSNRTLRVETYYKRYTSLVKYVDGDASQLNNAGSGYAKGVELFWRDNKSLRGVDYWVSYSYLDTKRDYLSFPYKAMPSFASKHNVSIVGKYFLQVIKCQLGATYSYTTGRPYDDPNSDVFNGGKTRAYADLSLNLAYLPRPNVIVYFSCTNLTGRNNIFGYEYGTERNADGLYNSRPIRQAAPRFAFIGIFITLSKDKSVNQLPSL